MISFSIIIASIILAALARVVVGLGIAGRWYVYPPVALALSYFIFGPSIWTPIFAAIAACNVGLGWTKWENREYQAARYAFLPVITAVVFMLFGGNASVLLWPILCSIVGAYEINIRRGLEPFGFTIFGREVGSAQYAEFVIGAVCLGGLVLAGV